jgi:hypothetical protein
MSAATFLNLCGFASLRDTAVLEAREEFFTLRRQGAKKTNESERRISSLNLSGFAPLRETAAIKGGEFFTLRRQGAKKTNESERRILSLNLSGFASLREIALIKGRPAFALDYGSARAGLRSMPAEEPTISYQPSAMSSQLCPV